MERRIENKTILDKFAENFCGILEMNNTRYVVCSGFVAIAHGRTRGTEDIDMIIEKLTKNEFMLLHEKLLEAGFICMQSDNAEIIYDDYLAVGESVRYVEKSEGFFPPEMEIKFAKDELDTEQINNRKKLPLTGLNVWFSSIESNIAFKEESLKSDKDLKDARHLRIIYENKIDNEKINEIKNKIKKLRMKNDRQES